MKLLKPNIYNDFDAEKAIKDLSNVIKYKTISHIDVDKYDYREFEKLHAYLKDNFPILNEIANVEIINKGSILFHINNLLYHKSK